MSKKIILLLLTLFFVGGILTACSSSSGGDQPPAEGDAPGAPSGGAEPSITITELTVFIGQPGAQGTDGVVVGTTNSGSSGNFTATYNIPSELAGESQLVIRVEGGAGYWAYHTFNNR
jgi:hypothetical protein